MSFRARLVAASLGLAIVPVAVLGVGVRRELNRQLRDEFAVRVAAVTATVEAGLATRRDAVAKRLRGLAVTVAGDNMLRAALANPVDGRADVLDYAARAMALTGLDVLRIQTADGRILSSGHFRNEFDAVDPGAVETLERLGTGVVLARFRTADTTRLVVAALDTVRIGTQRLWLAGGVAVDEGFIERLGGEDVAVTLRYPGGRLGPEPVAEGPVPGLRRDIRLPFVDATDAAVGEAHMVLDHSPAALQAVRRSVDRWLAVAALAILIGATGLALWLSARLSRPLERLARQTAVLDLDRLDVEFAGGRDDEVGRLARLLDALAARLRHSRVRLREAERRATVADLARQVNHDIKNALTPIRNVFRHLEQVARDDPRHLAQVLAERRDTLSASVAYLQDLAANYARLTPRTDRRPCDLNALVRALASERADGTVRLQLAATLPPLRCDPVVLRRILENLIGNAVESLDGSDGTVTVTTAVRGGERAAAVRIAVRDTGRGMGPEELEQAFGDFYTTKAGGTGLGLTIVRRLVADLGGTLTVSTEPGRGSTFTIDLPPFAEGDA